MAGVILRGNDRRSFLRIRDVARVRNAYKDENVLSVVAAIFLPLTFVTGLLGMNVGGLPGLDHPYGFYGSVLVMLLAAAALVLFFRWKSWF